MLELNRERFREASGHSRTGQVSTNAPVHNGVCRDLADKQTSTAVPDTSSASDAPAPDGASTKCSRETSGHRDNPNPASDTHGHYDVCTQIGEKRAGAALPDTSASMTEVHNGVCTKFYRRTRGHHSARHLSINPSRAQQRVRAFVAKRATTAVPGPHQQCLRTHGVGTSIADREAGTAVPGPHQQRLHAHEVCTGLAERQVCTAVPGTSASKRPSTPRRVHEIQTRNEQAQRYLNLQHLTLECPHFADKRAGTALPDTSASITQVHNGV